MMGFLLNDNNVLSMASNITLETRPNSIEHYGGSKKGEVEHYTQYWDVLNYRWTASKEMAIRNYILSKAEAELTNILFTK